VGSEILQRLDECGILDILEGTLSAGEPLLETVVEVIKTPEAIRTVRNLLLLTQVVGSIEPELLGVVARAVPEGPANISAKGGQAPGFFSLLPKFCSQDSRLR
jgi:hypothetical protein